MPVTEASLPRLIVAGTHSGVGKTTVVSGLLAALKRRGLKVQSYKTGPDYIDPGFHTFASGIPCRNLDTMLLSDEAVRELFHRSGVSADCSVIEGVMGLFDGASATDERGSASHLSKVLGAPIILVIDARAMARSAGALVHGFHTFDQSVSIAGVICNRVGGERHFEILKQAIEDQTGIPVLGYLTRSEEIALPERHLGLVPARERDIAPAIDAIADLVERTCDLERLLSIANSAPDFPLPEPDIFSQTVTLPGETPCNAGKSVRIAYAFDDAFHFYYHDNLDILEHHGAELVKTSPLHDPSLPRDIDLLYIGGGFPELFAKELSGNTSYLDSLRIQAADGLPVYAECGGLMYLVESLIDAGGEQFGMAALLPGQVQMDSRLRALGYCTAVIERRCLLGEPGMSFPGHVFHWSYRVETDTPASNALRLEKNDLCVADGYISRNVLAGYLHVHFGSHRSIPRNIIESARRRQSLR